MSALLIILAALASQPDAPFQHALSAYEDLDFETARADLVTASSQLTGPKRARAQLWLGIVELELGHARAADVQLRAALSAQHDLAIPERISPKIRAHIAEVSAQLHAPQPSPRARARRAASVTPSSPPPPRTATTTTTTTTNLTATAPTTTPTLATTVESQALQDPTPPTVLTAPQPMPAAPELAPNLPAAAMRAPTARTTSTPTSPAQARKPSDASAPKLASEASASSTLADEPAHFATWPLALGGGATLAALSCVTAGVVVGVSAKSAARDAQAASRAAVASATYQDARGRAALANVLFGGSVVFAAVVVASAIATVVVEP